MHSIRLRIISFLDTSARIKCMGASLVAEYDPTSVGDFFGISKNTEITHNKLRLNSLGDDVQEAQSRDDMDAKERNKGLRLSPTGVGLYLASTALPTSPFGPFPLAK